MVYGESIENAEWLFKCGTQNLHMVNFDGTFLTSSENVKVIREITADIDVSASISWERGLIGSL